MPIIAAQKKSVKRNAFLRKRNSTFKIAMKKAIHAVKKAVDNDAKGAELEKLLLHAYSTIDKAASKKIIHKGNAARKKSRLAKLVQNAS